MIDYEEIGGYAELSDNAKELFQKFLPNFLKRNEDLHVEPVSITECSNHLKFYFYANGDSDWLHVCGENTWY